MLQYRSHTVVAFIVSNMILSRKELSVSRRDKLLKKFFAERPPVDITWPELVAVAEIYGCTALRKTRHRAIAHLSDPAWVYPVPVHSDGEPIKRAYIIELRELFRGIDSEVMNDEI